MTAMNSTCFNRERVRINKMDKEKPSGDNHEKLNFSNKANSNGQKESNGTIKGFEPTN